MNQIKTDFNLLGWDGPGVVPFRNVSYNSTLHLMAVITNNRISLEGQHNFYLW